MSQGSQFRWMRAAWHVENVPLVAAIAAGAVICGGYCGHLMFNAPDIRVSPLKRKTTVIENQDEAMRFHEDHKFRQYSRRQVFEIFPSWNSTNAGGEPRKVPGRQPGVVQDSL
eukprot:TRINITY_DN1420_c0_g1_i2.p2 TRINITY_DN1420_c0_g1~~TRINITY_DN1420_c0_g1_i2.p2  ORF type:complete len:113 (+),score=33.74 TRINITY_DN1420_c0_g1_i2:130-468(+)